MQWYVLSEVCMISVLLYWPTPLALKAFTLDLYVLLKWSPSTVQMVSGPTYTSCKDTWSFLLNRELHLGCNDDSPDGFLFVFFSLAQQAQRLN